MRKKETASNIQLGPSKYSIQCDAQNPPLEYRMVAFRTLDVLSTTSGPVVVAAVFCLVFLVMGAAFSFSTFAPELGRDLKAGSGSISFIFGCAMALLYGGGLFSGALADRIGTHRIAGAGALLAGVSLAAGGAVGRVWQADVVLGLGFGLGLAICYTPAVAAVQPWFDRNRGVASGIALSGTGFGTLLMPLLARWLINDEGWRGALIIMGWAWVVSASRPRIGFGPLPIYRGHHHGAGPVALFASWRASRAFGGSTWPGSSLLSYSWFRSSIWSLTQFAGAWLRAMRHG